MKIQNCGWFTMGTTNDEMGSVEQTSSSSFNPLCFECGQQHWTRENHLYNYQDEVDDDLVCHICLQPLLQPLDTPCGHTFCCKCLRNFLQEKDFCPLDRKRLHFKSCKKSSILVHKLLDKLLVSCPFSSVCHDVMQRCDLEGHLKNRWARERESVAPGFVERLLKQTEIGNMNIKPTDRKYRFISISIFFLILFIWLCWTLVVATLYPLQLLVVACGI